jgi:uncharacterized protein YunC (DUF1805 family)
VVLVIVDLSHSVFHLLMPNAYLLRLEGERGLIAMGSFEVSGGEEGKGLSHAL